MSFIANQWTGNQFVSAYAPTLYVLLGRKSEAFIYTIIKSVVSLAAVFCAMLVVDRFGRRFVIIFGCAMQCIFLYLLAGMGMAKNPSYTELNTMVAAIQLFIFFCRGSVNALSFLIAAEVSSLTLRKKSMLSPANLRRLSALTDDSHGHGLRGRRRCGFRSYFCNALLD